jgi:hypothetical protein
MTDPRIELARQALIDTGYFTADEVGPDIAPRITEFHAVQEERAGVLRSRLAECTEMLTAAADTAMQRGKQLDAIRAVCTQAAGQGNHIDGVSVVKTSRIWAVLDGADGG